MDDFRDAIDTIGAQLSALGIGLTSLWLPVQLGLIALAIVIALAAGALVRRRTDLTTATMGWPLYLRLLTRALVGQTATIVFIVLLVVMRAALLTVAAPSRSYLLAVAINLATAWVVIALVTVLIRNRFIYRLVTFSAWTIAALSILGLLDPVADFLNSVAFVIGGVRITPLLILKTVVLLLVALWVASSVSNFLELRLRGSADLTPSMQVLVAKLIRFAFISFAILVVINSVGIDLSALALVGGAVGVGIGLGLQKIVANFVSGIILLADKSIKPGDVISVEDSLGWVVSMNARYVSVTTRDGREILIPNEELVTQRVVNWTFSKDDIRLEVKFSVDVVADPHQVRRVASAAALSVARVLAEPTPVCHFVNFSNKSLDFLLRFWIKDPSGGATNVRAAVTLALWDAFLREGIPIPPVVNDLQFIQPVSVELKRTPPKAPPP